MFARRVRGLPAAACPARGAAGRRGKRRLEPSERWEPWLQGALGVPAAPHRLPAPEMGPPCGQQSGAVLADTRILHGPGVPGAHVPGIRAWRGLAGAGRGDAGSRHQADGGILAAARAQQVPTGRASPGRNGWPRLEPLGPLLPLTGRLCISGRSVSAGVLRGHSLVLPQRQGWAPPVHGPRPAARPRSRAGGEPAAPCLLTQGPTLRVHRRPPISLPSSFPFTLHVPLQGQLLPPPPPPSSPPASLPIRLPGSEGEAASLPGVPAGASPAERGRLQG